MQGYSPKLPLIRDVIDGPYSMNKTALDSIKQDLKMLLLTSPGERMMNPDYGVGVRNYLFSQNNQELKNEISFKIRQQITKYMNFIKIRNINFESASPENENALYLVLEYSVTSINKADQLIISLDAN